MDDPEADLRLDPSRAVLMLQKEVVERLCASSGLARRACFIPSPEVDSAVVTVRFVGEIPDQVFESGKGRNEKVG